jgi:predicted phage-related endonuclease
MGEPRREGQEGAQAAARPAAEVCMTYNEIVCPDRATWLETRRTLGIGASEVPALFSSPQQPLRGLSSWESPYSLSMAKRGLVSRDPARDDEDLLTWGLYMEAPIVKWFMERIAPDIDFRWAAYDPGQFTIQQREGSPLFCTVDRFLVKGADKSVAPREAVLEIKNVSPWMADEWTEEPPLSYTLQVQAQLAVTGLPVGFVCASIGGGPPKWARVQRDEKMIRIIEDRVAAFWASVQANEDPPVDAHKRTAEAIHQRWPQDTGETRTLDAAMTKLWDERCDIKSTVKELDCREAFLTNTLKAAIAENGFGQLPDGRLLSCRTDKRGTRRLKEVQS